MSASVQMLGDAARGDNCQHLDTRIATPQDKRNEPDLLAVLDDADEQAMLGRQYHREVGFLQTMVAAL